MITGQFIRWYWLIFSHNALFYLCCLCSTYGVYIVHALVFKGDNFHLYAHKRDMRKMENCDKCRTHEQRAYHTYTHIRNMHFTIYFQKICMTDDICTRIWVCVNRHAHVCIFCVCLSEIKKVNNRHRLQVENSFSTLDEHLTMNEEETMKIERSNLTTVDVVQYE